MAASAFQSTTVERAPITAVLPTGIEPSLGITGLLFHKIGARLDVMFAGWLRWPALSCS